MDKEDLLERLRSIACCDYISDLRYDPWRKKAKTAIANMDLSKYSLFTLSDAAEYLYSEKLTFISSSAAQEYFRKRLRDAC